MFQPKIFLAMVQEFEGKESEYSTTEDEYYV